MMITHIVNQGGSIEAIIGLMFSGKTTRLITEVDRCIRAPKGKSVVFLRPTADNRQKDPELIGNLQGISISKDLLKATIFHDTQELWKKAQDFQVVIVDEGQFCPEDSADALHALFLQGKEIFFGGLDMDWKGDPFPSTARVLSLPEAKVTRLTFTCAICGHRNGTRSQLLGKDGLPIPITQPMPTINIGGLERFQPTCDRCWILTTPGVKEKLKARLPWLRDEEFEALITGEVGIRSERNRDIHF